MKKLIIILSLAVTSAAFGYWYDNPYWTDLTVPAVGPYGQGPSDIDWTDLGSTQYGFGMPPASGSIPFDEEDGWSCDSDGLTEANYVWNMPTIDGDWWYWYDDQFNGDDWGSMGNGFSTSWL